MKPTRLHCNNRAPWRPHPIVQGAMIIVIVLLYYTIYIYIYGHLVYIKTYK